MRSVTFIPVLLACACFHDGGNASSATTATEGTTGASTSASGLDGDTTAATSSTTSANTTSTSTSEDASTDGATDTNGTTGTTTGGTPPSDCGNGIIEGAEQCDLGDANADEGLCTTSCLKPRCGDGHVQPALGEECDLGDDLNNDEGACLSYCKTAACGDGHTWKGVEECDDGEDNQAGLYGGCTPMSCTDGPHCGDGELQKPQEECDLGDDNGTEDGPCTGMCKFSGNLVFVTSETYQGKIGTGGVAAADDACNTVAMEAGLANAGAFRAWISDGDSSPSQWDPKPEGPFVLSNATVVAENWEDLTDGVLAAPMDIDESGAKLTEEPYFAWTGTHADGSAVAEHCAGWLVDTKSQKGRWGYLNAVDASWTTSASAECQQSARLICVEE